MFAIPVAGTKQKLESWGRRDLSYSSDSAVLQVSSSLFAVLRTFKMTDSAEKTNGVHQTLQKMGV